MCNNNCVEFAGAVVGFNITEHFVNEGESIEICVFILFPSATVLYNSIVDGQFYIQGNSGKH